jgi:hypothetical protein
MTLSAMFCTSFTISSIRNGNFGCYVYLCCLLRTATQQNEEFKECYTELKRIQRGSTVEKEEVSDPSASTFFVMLNF